MKVKTLSRVALLTGILIFNSQGMNANPIIENAERYRRLPGVYINKPINGGTTTLKEKCEALVYFQATEDLGSIMKISFQIGFEHPIEYLTIQEACLKVGVYVPNNL